MEQIVPYQVVLVQIITSTLSPIKIAKFMMVEG